MKIITLPSGETLPALGMGTWNMGDSHAKKADEIAALRHGISLGIRIIDTAEMYGEGRAESLIGEAIVGLRDKVFLVSKVYPHNAGKTNIIKACERSLARLKTDCLDLYLLHWRGEYPLIETLAGFHQLQKDGKIRYWGVSNMDISDMKDWEKLPQNQGMASNQVLYNLTRRGIEWDLLPHCLARKMPIMAYSPIEQGRLLKNAGLIALAQNLQIAPAQLALAWILEKKQIMAIPKASKMAHVIENFAAANLTLTKEVLAALDQLFPPPTRAKSLEML